MDLPKVLCRVRPDHRGIVKVSFVKDNALV
jgi:hypothetical protein